MSFHIKVMLLFKANYYLIMGEITITWLYSRVMTLSSAFPSNCY